MYKKINTKSHFLYSTARNTNKSNLIPESFANLCKITVSKMVAAGILAPDYGNLDFWNQLPKKLSGIAYFERQKRSKGDDMEDMVYK